MPATAKLSYLRIAPRKVRLIADLIRNKKAEEAQTILRFTTQKAAAAILKLLKQAISNAKTSSQLEEKNLYISKILVEEGRKYKRWTPRARGMASQIQKKTSHVTIILEGSSEKRGFSAKRFGKKPPKKDKRIKKMEETRPEPIEKARGAEEIKKSPRTEKPKLRPEIETTKPKVEKTIRRIFRRKYF